MADMLLLNGNGMFILLYENHIIEFFSSQFFNISEWYKKLTNYYAINILFICHNHSTTGSASIR